MDRTRQRRRWTVDGPRSPGVLRVREVQEGAGRFRARGFSDPANWLREEETSLLDEVLELIREPRESPVP